MRKLIGATMACLLGGLLVGTPAEAGHGARACRGAWTAP